MRRVQPSNESNIFEASLLEKERSMFRFLQGMIPLKHISLSDFLPILRNVAGSPAYCEELLTIAVQCLQVSDVDSSTSQEDNLLEYLRAIVAVQEDAPYTVQGRQLTRPYL